MTETLKPHLKDFLLYLLVIIILILGAVFLFSRKTSPEDEMTKKESTNSSKTNAKTYANAPKNEVDINKKYTAVLTTNKGPITIELFTTETPVTVNNFVFLSKEGFYNDTLFHRVIPGFMIQGGDPNGDGTGGPGYTFADEKISRNYKRGIVAMANRGPNTNGSQFFVMHQDYDLPKQYVIFGQVTEGMDTVDKIAQIPTTENNTGEKSKPIEEAKIEKIEISEN